MHSYQLTADETKLFEEAAARWSSYEPPPRPATAQKDPVRLSYPVDTSPKFLAGEDYYFNTYEKPCYMIA